jgi:glutamine synthetase
MNFSVNAYLPWTRTTGANQIKASPVIAVRWSASAGRSRSAVRIAPLHDANPYLAIYAFLRIGLEGPQPNGKAGRRIVTLPDNIYDAIQRFRASRLVREILCADVQEKFAAVKLASADRCPRVLGSLIKRSEIQFHHEVTNQYLWSQF